MSANISPLPLSPTASSVPTNAVTEARNPRFRARQGIIPDLSALPDWEAKQQSIMVAEEGRAVRSAATCVLRKLPLSSEVSPCPPNSGHQIAIGLPRERKY